MWSTRDLPLGKRRRRADCVAADGFCLHAGGRPAHPQHEKDHIEAEWIGHDAKVFNPVRRGNAKPNQIADKLRRGPLRKARGSD